MQLGDEQTLKRHLTAELHPITDADPAVLSEYVIALLKNDLATNELKTLCVDQLTDFLAHHTRSFVDALFAHLTNQSQSSSQRHENTTDHQISINHINNHNNHNDNDKVNEKNDFNSEYRAERRRRRSLSPGAADRYDSYRPHEASSYGGRDRSPPRRRYAASREERYDAHDDRYAREDRYDAARGRSSRGRGRASVFNRLDRRSSSPDGPPRRHPYQHRRHNHHRGNEDEPRLKERSDKIAIEKIPDDACSEETVRDYFAKFGTLVSVVVYPRQSRAICQYETVDQALAAISSPEAPFGNRFVRIYWHEPHHIQPPTQQKPDADLPKPTEHLTPEEKARRQEEAERLRADILNKMELLKQKQEEQRRLLINKLPLLNEEDKQNILTSLSTVSKTIVETEHRASTLPTITPPSDQQAVKMEADMDDDDRIVIELGDAQGEKGSIADALKQKLATLKAEHGTMGLDAPIETDSSLQSFRPTPRGRGRGGYRGRGRGAWRGGRGGASSMSLDLRPKSLLVKNVPEEARSQLHSHFESFGGLVDIQPVPHDPTSAVIHFAERWQAEKAQSFGSQLGPSIHLDVSWYQDPSRSQHALPHAHATAATGGSDAMDTDTPMFAQ